MKVLEATQVMSKYHVTSLFCQHSEGRIMKMILFPATPLISQGLQEQETGNEWSV